MLHRVLRSTSCSQSYFLGKDSVWICFGGAALGQNRRPLRPTSHRTRTAFGGELTFMKRNLIAAVLALTVLATSACSGAETAVKPTAAKSPTTSTATSNTSNPTPTIEPKAQPAVDAYLAYMTASNNALRKPRALGQDFPPGADYTKYSFDPARSSLSAVIQQFSSQGLMMTGDPGQPRIQVQSLEIGAKPYPRVTLSDCPTPPVQWHPTDTKTGKDVSAPLPSGVAAPPHKVTIQVIFYQGRWGVSRTTSDLRLTCSA
jgi:hypothetical protein